MSGKNFIWVGALLCVRAFGQTPPIHLKTLDVKIPPALTLPVPEQTALGSQPLTLEEAVAIALRTQPQVGIAKGNFLSQQGKTQEAASGLFPKLSLGTGYSNPRTIRGSGGGGGGGGNSTQFTANLNVQQLLFDFGQTRSQVRQQSALETASKLSLRRTFETVALQVKLAYYSLIQRRAEVSISEANVANRQRQLDQARALSESGLGTPSDMVQAKANLADAAISLTSARDTALAAQISLAQNLGIDPRTPITTVATHEPSLEDESDLEKLVVEALKGRADILAAREQLSAAGFGLASAHLTNAPTILASAGLNGSGRRDFISGEQSSFGVSVSWTFGDGGFKAGKVKEATGNELAARANLVAVSNQAISDLSQASLDLQSALQRVELAQAGVANAQELVRVSEGRYRGGIGQFIDITNAQNTLFSSQKSLIQAQQDVERARASLRAALGL